MAMVIAVMGESGSGKSTSMRTLPPDATYYIDADGKGLPWRGWRQQYSAENKNYYRCSDKDKIISVLVGLNDKRPDIKYVVIDTINGIMIDDEMARMKEKSFDKWVDLASAVYGMIVYALKMRDDMTVIFIAHTQVDRDENTGMTWTRIKTNGRKLDKIVLESKFTTVFHARCLDGNYIFETRSNNSTAKTPMGAFDEATIENDIMKALERLEEYR